MRRSAALPVALFCLMAGACQSEPSFDERFEKADAEAKQLQQEIDRELAVAQPTKGEGPKAERAR
ncbi:MAG: hypothetical protein CL820_00395 [Croceicoccus sp.]|nr:hypothetical protein [Croceicoccus sp.]MAL24347.1 hypothetical protein [Croceicoccus sp.]|tara:strand:+ start:67011 stop:67205 length:195 start_codon:yes stop_codon:yes gene_type:complete